MVCFHTSKRSKVGSGVMRTYGVSGPWTALRWPNSQLVVATFHGLKNGSFERLLYIDCIYNYIYFMYSVCLCVIWFRLPTSGSVIRIYTQKGQSREMLADAFHLLASNWSEHGGLFLKHDDRQLERKNRTVSTLSARFRHSRQRRTATLMDTARKGSPSAGTIHGSVNISLVGMRRNATHYGPQNELFFPLL